MNELKKFRLKLTQELEMTVLIEAENKEQCWELYTTGQYEIESKTEENDQEWDCSYNFYEEIEEINPPIP